MHHSGAHGGSLAAQRGRLEASRLSCDMHHVNHDVIPNVIPNVTVMYKNVAHT